MPTKSQLRRAIGEFATACILHGVSPNNNYANQAEQAKLYLDYIISELFPNEPVTKPGTPWNETQIPYQPGG